MCLKARILVGMGQANSPSRFDFCNSLMLGVIKQFRGSTAILSRRVTLLACLPSVAALLRLCCASDLNFVSYLQGCCGCCGPKGGEGNPFLRSTEYGEPFQTV